MIFEIPVTADEVQEQSFDLFGYSLRLMLRFNRVSKGWQFDLTDQRTQQPLAQNDGLAVNAPALFPCQLPFVLMLADGSGLGLNSLSRGELGGRLKLYIIDKEVWREAIRQTAASAAR